MAKARIPHNISIKSYSPEGLPCFLSSKEFQSQVKNPMFINYIFDVDDKNTETVENFLKNYTDNNEDMMEYKLKQSYVDSFKQLQNTYSIIGGVLCFIVGFIGMLNFVNLILTIAIIITIGNVFSYIIVQAITGQIWFFTYKFTMIPILIAAPILVIILVIVPLISYKETSNQRIVQQLRENV